MQGVRSPRRHWELQLPVLRPLWWDMKDYQNRLYGGVRDDWRIIEFQCATLPHNDIDLFWAILDMLFSVISDTITPPYILAYQNGLLRSASTSTTNH